MVAWSSKKHQKLITISYQICHQWQGNNLYESCKTALLPRPALGFQPVSTAETRPITVGLFYEHVHLEWFITLSPVVLMPLLVKEGQSTLPQCLMTSTLPSTFLAPRYWPFCRLAQAQFGLSEGTACVMQSGCSPSSPEGKAQYWSAFRELGNISYPGS